MKSSRSPDRQLSVVGPLRIPGRPSLRIRMRSLPAILAVFCLQVGMARLCLCHGIPDGNRGEAVSCCHQPDAEETDPCPHCDHLDELVVSTPSKLLLAPDSPGTQGLAPMPTIELPFHSGPQAGPRVVFLSPGDRFKSSGSNCALFGVFLI